MSNGVAFDMPRLTVEDAEDSTLVRATGDWVLGMGRQAEAAVQAVDVPRERPVSIDASAIGGFDTSGAWLLHRLRAGLEFYGLKASIIGLSDARRQLIGEVETHTPVPWVPERHRFSIIRMLEKIGHRTVMIGQDAAAVTNVLGAFAIGFVGSLFGRSRLRLPSIVANFERTGLGAVPIMTLMSFLVGGIIAQQGARYLSRFGADIYVIDLAGVLVLRELGVLLTAIMFAGRSGSAFTAEIGSMKMREEIDALSVLGVSPINILIIPRLIALMLALPVLTFISDMAALAGAGMVVWFYLGIPPQTFISHLQDAIDIPTLMVGIVKAPFMALIIGLIASVEGMKVGGSTESLGRQTTNSVVKSIFMVIVVDGIFAMFFAAIGV